MKRKLFVTILAIILMAVLSISASAYITGDPDNDFLVTVADARYTLRLSVGLEKCEKDSDQYLACDANGDGDVTTADARVILRVAVGLDFFADHTEDNLNIRITKMPYKTNGLVINKISLQDDYFQLNITNKTSKTNMAVKSTSRIPYKMYNANGDVIYSDNVYVSQMNYNESCNVKIRNRSGNVKLVFGAATVDFTDAATVTATEKISGITVSKAPYTVQGITVDKTVIDAEKRKISFYVTNNSGMAASGSLKYLCYDANGNSLDSLYFTVPSLNSGEKVIIYNYYNSATAKIVFNSATCNESVKFEKLTGQYETRETLTVSKLPLSAQGITIAFSEIKYSYSGVPSLYLKITNNTGKTIDSDQSKFYVKSFDANGYLDGLTSVSIPELDNGESCIKDVYLSAAAKKVDIGNLSIKTKATSRNPGATSVIGGVTTNAQTGSFGGLVISDFAVNQKSNYAEITFKITNKTGKAISGTSGFAYKILSTDNIVMKTSEFYVSHDLNNNEYVYKTITVDGKNVGKCYFFLESVKDGTPISDSASYTTVGSCKVTATPYSSNGLKILSYRTDDSYLYIRIENTTGKSITSSSYFNYRIIGVNGAVVKSSSVYCNQMNAGETCEVKIPFYDDYAKITFMNAKIYN